MSKKTQKTSQKLQKIVWKQLLKLIMLNLLWKVFEVIFLQHLRPGYDGDPLKSERRNNPGVNVKGQNMLFIIAMALINHLISILNLLPIPIPINLWGVNAKRLHLLLYRFCSKTSSNCYIYLLKLHKSLKDVTLILT